MKPRGDEEPGYAAAPTSGVADIGNHHVVLRQAAGKVHRENASSAAPAARIDLRASSRRPLQTPAAPSPEGKAWRSSRVKRAESFRPNLDHRQLTGPNTIQLRGINFEVIRFLRWGKARSARRLRDHPAALRKSSAEYGFRAAPYWPRRRSMHPTMPTVIGRLAGNGTQSVHGGEKRGNIQIVGRHAAASGNGFRKVLLAAHPTHGLGGVFSAMRIIVVR